MLLKIFFSEIYVFWTNSVSDLPRYSKQSPAPSIYRILSKVQLGCINLLLRSASYPRRVPTSLEVNGSTIEWNCRKKKEAEGDWGPIDVEEGSWRWMLAVPQYLSISSRAPSWWWRRRSTRMVASQTFHQGGGVSDCLYHIPYSVYIKLGGLKGGKFQSQLKVLIKEREGIQKI